MGNKSLGRDSSGFWKKVKQHDNKLLVLYLLRLRSATAARTPLTSKDRQAKLKCNNEII